MDLERTTLFCENAGFAALCVLLKDAFGVNGADPFQFKASVALEPKKEISIGNGLRKRGVLTGGS